MEAEPNIHLLGHRDHRDLPAALRGADVGLIPYAINELTSSIFPMKVYEYLAAGLPVIATPLPSLAGVAEVETAVDAAGIGALIEHARWPMTPSSDGRRLTCRDWSFLGCAAG